MRAGLNLCFNEWALYRVWVDVPEYNVTARTMFDHLGFAHEGTLRKSRPHDCARLDSAWVCSRPSTTPKKASGRTTCKIR